MITLQVGTEKSKFNLKNFDREKSLLNAWKAMRGDSKYSHKKFKITTDTGSTIIVKIDEIFNLTFDPIELVRGKVSQTVG